MGQALCFIPEMILNKKIYGRATSLNLNKDKNKNSPLIIKYIYNDLSNKITEKDIIFIIIANLATLIIGFTKVKIQMNNNEHVEELIFNEQLNFTKLFFLFLFSYLIYKTKFYKHQYFSIFLILCLGFIRYILTFFYKKKYEMNGYILQLIIQIIIVCFESLILVYIKGLMQYKYISPYKASYLFGIMNSILVLIFFIIFSHIKCRLKWFCSLEYNGNNYLDNFYYIFDVYNYKQLIALIFASIFFGGLKLLINITMDKYSVCHLFLLIQHRELTSNVFDEIKTSSGAFYIIMILINHILVIFVILVFLEIIELNFWDLEKNLKRNIMKRAETELSLPENIDNNSNRPSLNEINN